MDRRSLALSGLKTRLEPNCRFGSLGLWGAQGNYLLSYLNKESYRGLDMNAEALSQELSTSFPKTSPRHYISETFLYWLYYGSYLRRFHRYCRISQHFLKIFRCGIHFKINLIQKPYIPYNTSIHPFIKGNISKRFCFRAITKKGSLIKKKNNTSQYARTHARTHTHTHTHTHTLNY